MTSKPLSFGFIVINISRQVHDRLLFIKGRQPYPMAHVVHRCIAAGNLVMTESGAGKRIYAGETALDFPAPGPVHEPATLPLPLMIHPDASRALSNIMEAFALGTHSALSWSISCYEILDEALVTSALHDGRNTTHLPLWAS